MASKDIVMAIAVNKSDLVRLKNIDTQDAVRPCSLICYNSLLEKRKNSADGLSPPQLSKTGLRKNPHQSVAHSDI
ncbi:hypothetical protein BS78_09G101600 [Paspalum vaginatum]|nr:hypothetical protein BS78_09G101600 [Paspalum vaginatum]